MRFKIFNQKDHLWSLFKDCNNISSVNYFRYLNYLKNESGFKMTGNVDKSRRRCRVRFGDKYEYGWTIETTFFGPNMEANSAKIELDREVKATTENYCCDTCSPYHVDTKKIIDVGLNFVEILNSDDSVIDEFQNQIISFNK